MYNVSDRSIRRYWQNLETAQPFHIFLKTKDGPVDIYVDRGGYASQRNTDTKNYDLSLGVASQIIRLIETGKTLPVPTPVWSVKDKTSEEALRPVAGYEVVDKSTQENIDEQVNKQQPGVQTEALSQIEAPFEAPSRPVSMPRAHVSEHVSEHVAASALQLVAAYKSGARKFRAGWDYLTERADGVLAWDLAIRKQVDKHWQTSETVTVALFTSNDGIVFPANTREYSAVTARRALIGTEPEVK